MSLNHVSILLQVLNSQMKTTTNQLNTRPHWGLHSVPCWPNFALHNYITEIPFFYL